MRLVQVPGVEVARQEPRAHRRGDALLRMRLALPLWPHRAAAQRPHGVLRVRRLQQAVPLDWRARGAPPLLHLAQPDGRPTVRRHASTAVGRRDGEKWARTRRASRPHGVSLEGGRGRDSPRADRPGPRGVGLPRGLLRLDLRPGEHFSCLFPSVFCCSSLVLFASASPNHRSTASSRGATSKKSCCTRVASCRAMRSTTSSSCRLRRSATT